MQSTLSIYAPAVTPRVTYVFNLIFKELLGIDYRFITKQFDFIQSPLPRISYNQRRITKEEFFVSCHTLLFEKNIQPQIIHCYPPRNGYKAFFKGNGDTDFPFDIFSAVFYLVSRYEEYLPHKKDEHGRFPAEASLAYRENFLQLPVINIWIEDFKAMLKNKFPGLSFHTASFRFRPTYDIDMAYRYLHNEKRYNRIGYMKDLVKGKWGNIVRRAAVLWGKQQDPYDCYDWLDNLHQQYQLHPAYFFLIGGGDEHDQCTPVSRPAMQELMKRIAAEYTAGLHPSWQSNEDNGRLQTEKQLMESVTGKTVTCSRQHYLKLEFPVTYQRLAAAGITDDYSMGYSSRNGFRAGICHSFLWYDLGRETATTLRIHPFCFMDVTASSCLHYSSAQALHELFQLADAVKKVNGELITLFHNESLGTDRQWKGWREAYEEFVKAILP